MPTATKAQLQEEGVFSPYVGHTFVPSLGDRGDCATGLYRTPTTVDHTTKTQSLKQIYLIHRNKHRKAAKMRRQRNMAQMKEQIKIPEKELNKMEISSIPDAEFKTLVIRMLK